MDRQQLFIKMAITAWEAQVARVGKLLETLTDEQLLAETAPGRNRGIYLVGHLLAVTDALFTLFGWGDRLYPQLENVFVKNPDKSDQKVPTIPELKSYWKIVHDKFNNRARKTGADEWFSGHTAVSAEDFAKEPHRNKLNVLLSRTNHMNYHLGQLIYLSKK